MGVYWNPANTCYYRSLERSAMNVYLATGGTSGTPTVSTPTGIHYTLPTPGAGAACPPKAAETPATPDQKLYEQLSGGPEAKYKTSERKLRNVLVQNGHHQNDVLSPAERAALQKAIEEGKLSAKGTEAAQRLAEGKPFSIFGIRSV